MLHSFGSASASGFICAIEARSNDVLVFTTAGRVYVVSYEYSKLGFRDVEEQSTYEDDIVVYDVLEAGNGYTYAATSRGICTLAGNNEESLWPIDPRYSKATHNVAYDGTNIWCGDESGNIFRVIKRDLELYASIGEKILGLYIINGIKIISTESGIKYESSHGTFSFVKTDDASHSNLEYTSPLVIPKTSSIYVARTDGSNYKIHNIALATTAGDIDYTYANGVKTTSLGNTAQVVGLAQLGNVSYALVNIFNANGSFSSS